MSESTDHTGHTARLRTDAALRLSDADREAVADRIRAAAAEGRLTLEEADERQQAAYAAKVEADLIPLTADLPAPPPPPPGLRTLPPDARRRLVIHAGIGLAVVLLVLVRWIVGPVSFFWPGGPIFWIAVSIAAHYWFATRRRSGTT
ncbi:DUF1707 domain-containing protein [Pseudonocardia halophobica]|uniref:DUF1707 domain-containing protein n=1 Tax=Pseudonocardia halophobica TaxID=29401 RepID=A0A9W6L6R7_9PSEU|nr:DUF1707 domain-containing protein [Pseudonocardia halophobica]GLL14686.1 hypothetical protein GCM10017577_58340 [Pseudonocardia halophobica]